MTSTERLRHFYDELIGSLTPQEDGRSGVPVERLMRMVREEPELCTIACQALVATGGTMQIQLALALAGAYEAEFSDDSLTLLVRQQMAEKGRQVANPTVTAGPPPEQAAPAPIHVQISQEMLGEGDIYLLVQHFSHRHLSGPDDIERLRRLRGRAFFTFPVSASDPREVWTVPEVRAYVRRVADAMPYFPYFLRPEPDLGMLQIWFLSLADLEALQDEGVDLLHDSVLQALGTGLLAARRLGRLLGDDDPDGPGRALLEPVDSGFRERLFAALDSADEAGDDEDDA